MKALFSRTRWKLNAVFPKLRRRKKSACVQEKECIFGGKFYLAHYFSRTRQLSNCYSQSDVCLFKASGSSLLGIFSIGLLFVDKCRILYVIPTQYQRFTLHGECGPMMRCIKCKGRSVATGAIVARSRRDKSVDTIYVFNARVIGAKRLIKSISRTIRCVRRARE